MQDMPDMVSQQKDEGDAAMMSARETSVTTKGGCLAAAIEVVTSVPPPPYSPQTASLEGESHAFEVQGASRSIGGPTPVVMPHLGEDFIGSVLQEADAANFYAEFEAELNV
jgi:hypothetical protein